MKPGQLLAALLLAAGISQYTLAEEATTVEPVQTAQATQQATPAKETAPATRSVPVQSKPAARPVAAQDKPVVRQDSTPPAAPRAADSTPATAAPVAMTAAAATDSASAAASAASQSTAAASAAATIPSAAAQTAPPASPEPQTSWLDSFLYDIKLTDVLLAVFTGLLVVLGVQLARRMREAVGAAKDSAAVAEKSARTAEEALVAGQRAFMFIREIKTYLHQDPETGSFHWTIHPVWANSGNTPTRGLAINTSYRLLDKPLPEGYDFPESKENLVPTIAGPRSMVEAQPGSLSSEDLEAVKEGKKYFYIWGWAEYHDIFEGTKKRVTRFCNQLVQVDGNPMMPADEHNPIQMMFGFHAENNYAD